MKKRRSECGAARRERGDIHGNVIFIVRQKYVIIITDGGSLSINKDAGEVQKATNIIPKERRPSIDEFGFRSALGIRKSHSGLTSEDNCHASSGS